MCMFTFPPKRGQSDESGAPFPTAISSSEGLFAALPPVDHRPVNIMGNYSNSVVILYFSPVGLNLLQVNKGPISLCGFYFM